MSALHGARVRVITFTNDDEGQHVESIDGVVVAVAAQPASSGFPLPPSWQCLVLVDGAAGEGALRVVDATRLAVLTAPGLVPTLSEGDASVALTEARETIKRQQLVAVKLEDEAAGLAAEVAALKKKIKKAAPAKAEPMDEGGE